jgi:hypothetical protein
VAPRRSCAGCDGAMWDGWSPCSPPVLCSRRVGAAADPTRSRRFPETRTCVLWSRRARSGRSRRVPPARSRRVPEDQGRRVRRDALRTGDGRTRGASDTAKAAERPTNAAEAAPRGGSARGNAGPAVGRKPRSRAGRQSPWCPRRPRRPRPPPHRWRGRLRAGKGMSWRILRPRRAASSPPTRRRDRGPAVTGISPPPVPGRAAWRRCPPAGRPPSRRDRAPSRSASVPGRARSAPRRTSSARGGSRPPAPARRTG